MWTRANLERTDLGRTHQCQKLFRNILLLKVLLNIQALYTIQAVNFSSPQITPSQLLLSPSLARRQQSIFLCPNNSGLDRWPVLSDSLEHMCHSFRSFSSQHQLQWTPPLGLIPVVPKNTVSQTLGTSLTWTVQGEHTQSHHSQAAALTCRKSKQEK